jgi:NAD(P)-dependent dehydrogenase (short-subunit alcohol dehydrogenase family)
MQYDQNALTVDVKTVEQCMDTNFYGVIRVTQTFIPLLRAAAKSEGYAAIVNVSSLLGSNTSQSDPNNPARRFIVAYNTSKAAMNSYGIALAHELKDENIKVVMGTPGFCSSNLNGYREGGRPVKDGAESLLPWVLVGKDAETGTFHHVLG